MSLSKSKSGSRIIKFGKAPAKRDSRNLQLSAVLKAVPKIPAEYDFDVDHHGVPTPMFCNNEHGCCVISGRAHQTLRFEDIEQNKIIKITDDDVLKEWYKENGGTEDGLYVLDSLKEWRTGGWIAAKKRYKIKAFMEIKPKKHQEVKKAIFLDIGAGFGFSLPDSSIDQFHAGTTWTVTADPPNPDNGHYVFMPGYIKKGPVCVTWGSKQQMTWGFLDKYCDEAYAVIDAPNTPKKKQYLDGEKIDEFLAKLKK
jgi:hypothetical protein